MDKEEFVWKAPKDIWKGVGIYHLTFNVACDSLKLGTIRGRSKEEIAAVVQPKMAQLGLESAKIIKKLGQITCI